jgi:predicted nucleic acid-binding protein
MIVLDASAIVDVLVGRPAQDWVLSQMHGERLFAPSHQPAEVLSAVARLVRGGQLQEPDARQATRDFVGLEQTFIVPTTDHLGRALDLQPRVRVLDGLYVAVAESLSCPVITTDLRLARAGLPVDVRSPLREAI